MAARYPTPEAEERVGWAQVLRWRMERQLLGAAGRGVDAVDVARRLCGVHAQLAEAVR